MNAANVMSYISPGAMNGVTFPNEIAFFSSSALIQLRAERRVCGPAGLKK